MKVEDIDIRTMDLKRGKTVVWSSGYQVQNRIHPEEASFSLKIVM
jgi:hypothetical protein